MVTGASSALRLAAALFCVLAITCEARVLTKMILGGGGSGSLRLNYSSDFFEQYNPGGSLKQSLNMCDNCVCGVARQSRIVDGEITSTYEFPWVVRIMYQDVHHCGGSMITRKHVLTASHCIDGFDARYFSLRFADNSYHRIKKITMHKYYEKVKFNNDIAIIELDSPVNLSGDVRTICLPDADPTGLETVKRQSGVSLFADKFDYTGAMATAIGWGRIAEGDVLSDELRKVSLPIMSSEECSQSDYAHNRLTDNMFCAGYLEGERDTCNGDSGGPLQVRGSKGAMEVVGIVSFGRGCARPSFPGVYTKVTNYVRNGWIANRLNGECICPQPEPDF